MKLLVLTLVFPLAVVASSAGTAHAAGVRAHCTINSTHVSAAGQTLTTPSITVPCP
jgi:hypothetical protein